jgi:hypothetical protein
MRLPTAERARDECPGPCDRPEPGARSSAALTAEEWPYIRKDRIGQIEQSLKRTKSKDGDREAPREPSCVGQVPQYLCYRFPPEPHRAIGHEQVDRRISVPDIQIRVERPKRLWVGADGSLLDAGLGRASFPRSFHPTRHAPANSAFVIVKKDRSVVLLELWK